MVKIKCGIGFDVHAFAPDRKLIIGGIDIPFEYGLAGHSDADVLVHAIIDSIVGAALGKDIGRLFPDNDMTYKDIDSMVLLKRAVENVLGAGYQISSIDATIIAQTPKMMPYIDSMRKRVADVIGLDFDDITIKATTTEHLGFTGRKEGIAALAVSTLIKGDGNKRW